MGHEDAGVGVRRAGALRVVRHRLVELVADRLGQRRRHRVREVDRLARVLRRRRDGRRAEHVDVLQVAAAVVVDDRADVVVVEATGVRLVLDLRLTVLVREHGHPARGAVPAVLAHDVADGVVRGSSDSAPPGKATVRLQAVPIGHAVGQAVGVPVVVQPERRAREVVLHEPVRAGGPGVDVLGGRRRDPLLVERRVEVVRRRPCRCRHGCRPRSCPPSPARLRR